MRLLAALLLVTSTVTGPNDPTPVLEGWKTSPVYVDSSQRSLVSDEAAEELADRVEDHEPAIRIAVVPAEALDDGRRDRYDSARAYVESAVDKQAADGIYLVVFGNAVTWGSAVGVDAPVADIVADERRKHSRSDAVGTLNGVLDRLDVPKASSGPPVWLWIVAILLVLLVGGWFGLRWWRSRPDDGPALYRPPYDVLPAEADTLAERRALVREDVTRFGEELDAADMRPDGRENRTDTTADVQAAMNAYADAGRVVDGEPDDEQLLAVRATVGYGRWRLACAQARIAGRPAPQWRALCFFNPAHGTSVKDSPYTPPIGRRREVPVCAACQGRLSGVPR